MPSLTEQRAARSDPGRVFPAQLLPRASLMIKADVEVRHQIGAERIMWGADYPHHEGTWPHTKLALRVNFSDVPEDEVRAMTSVNAASVYGFDLDLLQTVADRIGPTVEEIATPTAASSPATQFLSDAVGRRVGGVKGRARKRSVRTSTAAAVQLRGRPSRTVEPGLTRYFQRRRGRRRAGFQEGRRNSSPGGNLLRRFPSPEPKQRQLHQAGP